ncbi:YdiL family protein [Enterobacteriaceae bacterium H11S18]|uniref:Aca2/YdiL-like domain-containing protein n=1 Tax=Dryocola clanedunensis TaxID=2925396 RepID=UPI0022F0D900|nr:DUF1870 family protein [Dryocola clanedunensis]MCT4710666.1 YdiL family protein [Dryocola clanedunensis]
MNNFALLACRKLLFLDVVEAAKHIGGVEPRTWRYYESGRSSLPDAIVKKMHNLIRRRESLLKEMRLAAQSHRQLGQGRQVVPYYVTFEQFVQETGLDDVLEWRLDMSVKSALYIEDLLVFY